MLLCLIECKYSPLFFMDGPSHRGKQTDKEVLQQGTWEDILTEKKNKL